MKRFFQNTVLAGLTFLASACSGNSLGGLGDILAGAAGQPAGAQQGQISAEIRAVDTNQRLITVLTADNKTGNVRYDQNTTVVFEQKQYDVTALERGDLVVMTVTQDAQGNVTASRIDVTQSAQQRTGTTGSTSSQIREYSGRITSIDHNRGTLVLAVNGGSVTVSLPYNPPAATLNYFHSLRVGNDIRLEGTVIGTNRVEIYRFL
jgi:hypothetical protein